MKSGCSSRQAVHQEAKTLTSETSPFRSALDSPSVRPWTGGSEKSGTGLPINAEGSSRGSRVSPQASATASTRKRTTGTMNAARHDVRERCVDSVASDVSLIIPSPAMVEEEVLDERRSCEDRSEEHTSELQSLMSI